MQDCKYRLRYLPLFYNDLEDTITYITYELKNPQAAFDLLDKVELEIKKRLPFAESFECFKSVHKRKNKYYRIYIDNFIIYYVVIDDDPNDLIMEVRRFLYNKRNTN